MIPFGRRIRRLSPWSLTQFRSCSAAAKSAADVAAAAVAARKADPDYALTSEDETMLKTRVLQAGGAADEILALLEAAVASNSLDCAIQDDIWLRSGVSSPTRTSVPAAQSVSLPFSCSTWMVERSTSSTRSASRCSATQRLRTPSRPCARPRAAQSLACERETRRAYRGSVRCGTWHVRRQMRKLTTF